MLNLYSRDIITITILNVRLEDNVYVYPARAARAALCDQGWCVFIYMTPKSLNDTLAVDLPFQTLAVNFSSKL